MMEFYSENVTNAVCSVGDKVKLSRPVGYPPVTWENDADVKIYLKGFRVVYPELGEFDGLVDAAGDRIYYKHLKSGRQIIEFVSLFLGRHYFYLILEGIVVHDHASIPQGGPAYATYYSEPEEGSGEES